MYISWAGKHVAEGNASKAFHPFLLPELRKGNPKELKEKLLVDFDPQRCFIGDLEASFLVPLALLATLGTFSPF